MNFRLRRMSDGVAGAILATVLLAGGAAYAATGGLDDNPKGDTPTTDDRVAREAGVTSATEVERPGVMERRGETERESTTSTTSPTSTTTSRALSGAAPVAGTTATPVLDAGQVTVTVDGALLRIVSATPAAGWSVEVERDNAREIEVSFRSGSARVDFNAELEDNAIRIRIRDRRTEATNGSTTSTSTTVAGSGGGGTATVRTVQSAGGSVTVSQRGDSVTLVVATPATGFAADVRKSGPDTVEVRFTNGKRESRVELSIDNGTPRERVEDR